MGTCPSTCGGASCDSFTVEVFDLEERMETISSSSPREFLGLISQCAGAPGCSMSSEGRLKELLADHLIAQNALSSVLQSSAKVENLIDSVSSRQHTH